MSKNKKFRVRARVLVTKEFEFEAPSLGLAKNEWHKSAARESVLKEGALQGEAWSTVEDLQSSYVIHPVEDSRLCRAQDPVSGVFSSTFNTPEEAVQDLNSELARRRLRVTGPDLD